MLYEIRMKELPYEWFEAVDLLKTCHQLNIGDKFYLSYQIDHGILPFTYIQLQGYVTILEKELHVQLGSTNETVEESCVILVVHAPEGYEISAKYKGKFIHTITLEDMKQNEDMEAILIEKLNNA